MGGGGVRTLQKKIFELFTKTVDVDVLSIDKQLFSFDHVLEN